MSIATRINSIEEHIGNAYDKLDDLGIDLTDVDKNIDNIATVLEEYYDDQPKVTGEGTEVTLEETKVGKIGIDIKGNSTQETTTGKNLYDASSLPVTQYGITISRNANGDIVLNGTPNYQSSYKTFAIGVSKDVEAGTYTISVANKKDGIGVNVGGFSGQLNLTMSDTVKTKSATSTQTYTITPQINIRYDVGTLTNYVLNPMLEKSASATDYEPYTDGPSPNPSYPQPIHSAGDNANLFDKTKITNSYYLNNTGATSYNANWTISDYIPVFFNVITYSGLSATGTAPYSCWFDESKNFLSSFKQQTGENTLNVPEGAKYLRFSVNLTDIDNFSVKNNTGSIIEKIVNKNLINLNNLILRLSGASKVRSSVNEFVMSGKATWSNLWWSFENSKKNQDYTISAKYLSALARKTGFSIYGNTVGNSSTESVLIASSTFDLEANTKTNNSVSFNSGEHNYIIVRIWNNDTGTALSEAVDLEVTDIMLELGSTATPYVAHQEQTYAIPVQQPMKYLEYNDTHDDFIKQDGNWYERHKIEHIITDGTKEITIFSSNTSRTVFSVATSTTNRKFIGIGDYQPSREKMKSTHFITVTQGKTWANGDISTRGDGSGYATNLYMTLGPGMSIQDFKDWLSENNVETDVILVEPLLLPCTSEQTQALEALAKAKSYKDTTIIYSEDGTPAYLNAAALKK